MTAATIAGQRAQDAVSAWNDGARRRRTLGLFERASDAAIASGGILMANAAFAMDLGLPAGGAGLGIGGGLLAAGIAWVLSHRRPHATRESLQPRGAMVLRMEPRRAA